MRFLPAHEERNGRQEKKSLVSNVRPISRDPSASSSQSSDRHKALPDPPLSHGERWRRFWERPFLNTWLAEILALAFSVACLTAIVIVLTVYQSRSIPQIPFGLTLNAIISILATGSKSSLLLAVAGAISQLKWSWFATRQRKLEDIQEFDDASRGPWGSVTLLFTINIRSLASIGALITVLTLAYDPFVQQVLKYPVRIVNQASNEAATSQAQVWIPDTYTPEFGDALNAGIWGDDTAFMRDPACPSGNCNWPPFRSMGWCSKCENVTSRIALDDCPFEDYYDEKFSTLECNLTLDYYPSTRYAWGNTTFSWHWDDREKKNRTSYHQEATILSGVSWPLQISSSDTGPTILGVDNPALVFGFVSLYYLTPNSSVIDQTDGRIRPSIQQAEQCVLTPCARTYNVSTVNGAVHADVLEENYGISTWYTVKQVNNAMSPFNTQSNFCWQPDPGNLTWHYIVPEGPTGARTGLYNPWIPVVAERFVNASHSGFCKLQTYQDVLVAALNGTGEVNARGMIPGEGQGALWEWLDRNPYSNSGWSAEYSNPALHKIKTTNLTTVVGSIAASLTKLGLDLSNVTVHGNVSTTEVYVQAEWKWLIFPMALEVLGIVLLISTMVISRVRRTRLWKSSVLPLLYHGLEDDVARNQSPPEDVFGMEELARKTQVRLGSSRGHDRIILTSRDRVDDDPT